MSAYVNGKAYAPTGGVSPAKIIEATENWLEENIDPATGYAVDSSLSIEGAAADAKKVGDEINDSKSTITQQYADIFSIGSDAPYINLFDKSATDPGKYLNTSGVEVDNPDYLISDYIPVDPHNIIYFYGWETIPANTRIFYYDAGKEQTGYGAYSYIASNGRYIEWVPQNTAFLRFSVHKNDINKIRCLTKKASDYPVNLISAAGISGARITKYLEADTSPGYWNTETKAVVTNSRYQATSLYPVKKGDIITIDNATSSRPFVLYAANSNEVISYKNVSTTVLKYHFTHEVEEDGVIGFNIITTDATNTRLYINGRRIPKKSALDWLDLEIPEGVTWSTWVNKLAVMFGDSLVSGQRDDSAEGGAYCRRLKEHLSLADCENRGVSGRPVADGTASGDGTVTSVLAVSDYASYDLVIIAGGTNDFKLNVPIGAIGSVGGTFDRTTFYGALQTIAEYLMLKKANIRVCLWTPLQRNNDGYDITTTNTAGHKLSDYCDAIKAVGKLYAFPVVDMYEISGVNMINLTYYTADGLHLNGNGYDLVSYVAAKKINVL